MRINSLGASARPASYDRNQLNVNALSSTATLAPAGATNRWTYTVPTGRKAELGALLCTLQRQTVAAPVGLAQVYILMAPNGGGNAVIQLANIFTNAIGDQQALTQGVSGVCGAGDILIAQTADSSTGGTVRYTVTAKVMEFDA